MKTETVITMDYDELEDIIFNHYGVEFDFVAAEECGNDSDHTFTIDRKEEIDEYDKGIMDNWLKGKRQAWTRTLLQDLVNCDALQPGKYLIQVCW